ncbi:hypothetical protein BDQ17DRAFT_1379562, partial [Cyathus striatus]
MKLLTYSVVPLFLAAFAYCTALPSTALATEYHSTKDCKSFYDTTSLRTLIIVPTRPAYYECCGISNGVGSCIAN